MAHAARQRYTFREYIELEELSPVKHEFLDGEVWAMAGGTPHHAAVSVNVSALLQEQLRSERCRVFSSDLRIRVMATGLGTYPDVSVVCDELQTDPEDPSASTVINPRVVVEILSPSTEDYDRGEKLDHYKAIPSLAEIVLVAHDQRRVDVWRRHADGWTEIVTREQGRATLASIGASLPLDEV
jgi:Uma2 family endonuclease